MINSLSLEAILPYSRWK